MTGRETFTRAEVRSILRHAVSEQLRAASGMMRHNSHPIAAEVLGRMAIKVTQDDGLVTSTLLAAEDQLPASVILDVVA